MVSDISNEAKRFDQLVWWLHEARVRCVGPGASRERGPRKRPG